MIVRVFVPATSANLGAGFDVFGIAINLFNEFIVESANTFAIQIHDPSGIVPITKENLFYTSFVYLFKKVGKKVPVIKIQMNIQIPQSRGLGSSATAVVGGLVAANAYLNNMFSKDQLLPFAIELEHGNHADNVAPALFGGLVVTSKYQSKYYHVKLPLPPDIKAVFYTPDVSMDTMTGRKLMPTDYSPEVLVFSTSRVALMLAALQTHKYQLFKIAMQDMSHQPTRAKIFPPMNSIIQAALDAGAFGSALSGGGSSIIALANKNFKKIEKAMAQAGEKNKITGISKTLELLNEGVFLYNDRTASEKRKPRYNDSEK